MFTNKQTWSQELKQICIIGVTGAFLLSTIGCDERDVIAGVIIGGAIGGAIAGAAGGGPHRPHRPHHPPHHPVPPPHHGPHFLVDINELAEANTAELTVDTTAANLNLSVEATTRFLNFVEQAQNGNVAALQNIGLTSADLAQLAQLKMVSDQSVQSVANALGVEFAQAEWLIQQMLNETAKEMQDITGTVWQFCMAKGSWKTPQNGWCKKTYWQGCSPQTGATLCLPAN